MSEAQVAAASSGPEPPQLQPTEAVRLRAPSPRIVRLSPKVLIGLSATSAAALFGLVLFALHMHGPHAAATNLVDSARPNPAEAVKNAASDYAAVHQSAAATGNGTPGAGGAVTAVGGSPAGVPKLGPALPGDLGRPILNAQTQGSAPIGGEPIPSAPAAEPPTVDPVRQKLAQERVAALTSPRCSRAAKRRLRARNRSRSRRSRQRRLPRRQPRPARQPRAPVRRRPPARSTSSPS